ncbi:MAG: hypothetical protein GXZ07_09710 [Firmicutes bacterium]|nr:hypothetical protein [Bacillota bacterium]
MDTKNLQPHLYPGILTAEIKATVNRVAVAAARESGEKLAGSFNGDFVSFAKILAKENEKQRKMQDLKHGSREELKKAQPL